MTVTVLPSAFAVSSTPSRMRGLGAAVAASVRELTTALPVSFVPSWNVTPSRIVNVHFLPDRFHPVASAGSASPSASSFTRVSAVDQRDSLNASSDSGDRPERGGSIIATRIRPPSPEAPPSSAPVDEKQPVSRAEAAVVTAVRGTKRAGRRTGHSE